MVVAAAGITEDGNVDAGKYFNSASGDGCVVKCGKSIHLTGTKRIDEKGDRENGGYGRHGGFSIRI